MYTVTLYGDRAGRIITTFRYPKRGMAMRVARSWARWGVPHCGSAHGMARGAGYKRWDFRGRTVYDQEAPGVRRAIITEYKPAVWGHHKSFAYYLPAPA